MLNIVLDIWWTHTSWSINWELHVESLSRFTSLETWLASKGQIQRWCLPWSTIWFAIIKTESTLDLFGFSYSLGDGVDLPSQIFLSADAAWVCILRESISLHGWMNHRWTWPWILLNSLIVALVGILVNIVSFVERDTIFSLFVTLLHLFLIWFNDITRVNDWPAHAHMRWLEIRVGSVSQTLLEEVICLSFGLVCTFIPILVRRLKIRFSHFFSHGFKFILF